MDLLNKTRKLNRLLQKAAGNSVNFVEMAEVLRDVLVANVYIVSRKGKVLGHATSFDFSTDALQGMVLGERRFPEMYNSLFLSVLEACSTVEKEHPHHGTVSQIQELFQHPNVAVIPVLGGRDRLGTVVLTRETDAFYENDYILGEYGSTIVGMEILRERADELEIESRSKAVVQVAVGSLSFSEMEAVEHIFEELKGKEGLLVASKIADRVGITRSVIVNALRKLESAGVIETRSLGMKGTYIKILNEKLIYELEKANS